MKNNISRRDFLKITGNTAGALALGSFVPPEVISTALKSGHINNQGNGYIPTLCEMCVWRCGVLAKSRMAVWLNWKETQNTPILRAGYALEDNPD